MIRPIVGAVMALALLGSAALGQGVAQGDVVAACAAQQGNCLTVLRAYLQGLAPATRNAAVGDLVVALAGLPEAMAVAAIREAAQFSSDAGQVARIGEIAATIAAGATGETAAIAETSSSPA